MKPDLIEIFQRTRIEDNEDRSNWKRVLEVTISYELKKLNKKDVHHLKMLNDLDVNIQYNKSFWIVNLAYKCGNKMKQKKCLRVNEFFHKN